MSYCHNCGHWSMLKDRVFCSFCLTFYYKHGRLPVQKDEITNGKSDAKR